VHHGRRLGETREVVRGKRMRGGATKVAPSPREGKTLERKKPKRASAGESVNSGLDMNELPVGAKP